METADTFQTLGSLVRALVSQMQPAPTVLLEISPPIAPTTGGMELLPSHRAPGEKRPEVARVPRVISGRWSAA